MVVRPPDTLFLPPSTVPKWRGLRGLAARCGRGRVCAGWSPPRSGAFRSRSPNPRNPRHFGTIEGPCPLGGARAWVKPGEMHQRAPLIPVRFHTQDELTRLPSVRDRGHRDIRIMSPRCTCTFGLVYSTYAGVHTLNINACSTSSLPERTSRPANSSQAAPGQRLLAGRSRLATFAGRSRLAIPRRPLQASDPSQAAPG